MDSKVSRRSLDDIVLGRAGTWRRTFTSLALIALGGWGFYLGTNQARREQPEVAAPTDPEWKKGVQLPVREEVTFVLPKALFELWVKDSQNLVFQDTGRLGEFVEQEGIETTSAVVRKRLYYPDGSTRETEDPIPLFSQGHRLIGHLRGEEPGRERTISVKLL
jgi:hypothetical protein